MRLATLGCPDEVVLDIGFAGRRHRRRVLCRAAREGADSVTGSLRAQLPELGRNIAIDGSDMPAYANGQRFVSKGGRERADSEFSDPDASWGHRSAVSTRKGGGFYGYKLDLAVCTATDLPVSWNVRTARDQGCLHAMPLIDKARERGFVVETA